jgi:hypothetical protein
VVANTKELEKLKEINNNGKAITKRSNNADL